ncbi:exonuclease SbcCD subunit D [Coleofasciculus sp. FACHB-SPT9]|uniref:metallophosphoesterase family protein n=1 Tax=Cyanophyceae TaxID=3028117 RepID=UPI001684ABB7|nr:exonuclease SbcCD subunit D [Coleofasciculus sp. FACHB-SPT9]MBD1890524.1 exonuclease SbcCD subunit D [Coleofasciculus sp. FACHB-SPT9]
MRLIHTSDWHLGRRLKGIDRTPEIDAALNELLESAKTLEVDAVLVAGDIFDVPSPTADAEKVAYNFFCQLREAKIPAVVIAGNHDSAFRIDGVSRLLSHVGVQALGRPRKANQGGVIQLDTPSGKLSVAAMPFASERRLLKAEDLWEKDDLEQRQHYKDRVAYLFKNLASNFREDSVNVVMAHLTIDGALRAYSEVDYYTRDTYSLSGQTLPSEAQYIALGHIHKPQQVSNAAPTYYSGSLIQVDFGEAGEEKGFNLVTVEPGRPAKVEFKSIPCQKPLKVIQCDENNLDEALEANQKHPGFLKVIVDLNSPKIGLADRVRKVCPQALIIEPKYPEVKSQKRQQFPGANQFDAVEEFRNYWRDRLGTTPDSSVFKAFEKLYQELSDATH